MKMEKLPGKESKKDLLILKDGDSAQGMIIGEFYTYYAKFNGKYYEKSSKGVEGAKFRFRVTFAVKNGGTYTPKVLEQGAELYKRLFEVNEQYPLEESPIIIKRKGSGATDTEYLVTAVNQKKNPITADEAAQLASIQPLDLSHSDDDSDLDKALAD
jgi:hypothetical protein